MICQVIGLREQLQENPMFHGKIMENRWFPVDFPLSQPIESGNPMVPQPKGPRGPRPPRFLCDNHRFMQRG